MILRAARLCGFRRTKIPFRLNHIIPMNSKSILLFAAGLVIGLGVSRLVSTSRESDDPPAPVAVEANPSAAAESSGAPGLAEMAALRTELTEAREEIARLRDVAASETPETEAAETNPLAAFMSPDILGPFMEAQSNTEIAATLNRLANSLGLSDEQRESLRNALAENAARSRELMTKSLEAMQSGDFSSLLDDGDFDLDGMAGSRDTMRNWARDNLSDDQFEEFERIEERDQIAQAEQTAQFAVSRLNRVAALSEEQKDLAFQHYAAGALGTPDQAPALDEILTPAQMAAYEENQRQEEAMSEDLMRAMGLDPGAFADQDGVSVQIRTAVEVD